MVVGVFEGGEEKPKLEIGGMSECLKQRRKKKLVKFKSSESRVSLVERE